MNNVLPSLNTAQTPQQQMLWLHEKLAQVWRKQTQQQELIDKLLAVVDTNVSTKRILEIINDLQTQIDNLA